MSLEQRKFFFVHVMKTGGGTFRRHLWKNFKRREVYPFRPLDPDYWRAQTKIDYLAALPPERREEIRVYCGHFPYCAMEMAGIEATTLTILRHPVERTLSYLRHRQRTDDRPLEAMYDDLMLFRMLIRNHQTKVFSLKPEDEPKSFLHRLDEQRLELAKANLRQVDVVGITERFDDFCAEAATRFGWTFGEIEDQHAHAHRRDVPDSFRRRIAEENAADMELHEHARELFDRRRVGGVARPTTGAPTDERAASVWSTEAVHASFQSGPGSASPMRQPEAHRRAGDGGGGGRGGTDPKFFFVHVMKTAGGTLRRHILANFRRSEVYPLKRLDPDLHAANYAIAYLTSLPPERLAQTRVFTGHFPYVAVELLGLDVVTLTILRNPVDRTISYLRACKRNHVQHRPLSLEQIYDDPVHFPMLIKNHQAKLFAMTADDDPESQMHVLDVDADRLALAKRNLEKVDVFGLQDHFGEFLAELEARFGWQFGEVPNKNVGGGPEVAESFRRRIAEDNAADMEFYEHAREAYERRHSARGVA